MIRIGPVRKAVGHWITNWRDERTQLAGFVTFAQEPTHDEALAAAARALRELLAPPDEAEPAGHPVHVVLREVLDAVRHGLPVEEIAARLPSPDAFTLLVSIYSAMRARGLL